MVKEINITVPTDYSTISLKKFLTLQKELENYSDDEEAMTAIMLWHLCGLDPEYVKGLSITDYAVIKKELDAFMFNTELPLQRFITIDGVEYGFEPNLSEMSYGAYADITKYETIAIDGNWSKIMAILYRPIISRLKDTYQIKPYDTNEVNPKLFEEVGMDVHFGALFFFVRLSTDLLNSTLNSLKETELHPSIKPILERSGELIQQSMNWQKEISLNTMKLRKNL